MRPRYDQSPGLSLADRPFPRRELLPKDRLLTPNVFEATRGCILNSDFRLLSSALGRKPLQKPVEDVASNERQIEERKLIFVDLKMIAYRDHSVRVFTALFPLK